MTVGLNWTSGAEEVVAGETYPYEITVTNNTEDTLEGAEVSTTFTRSLEFFYSSSEVILTALHPLPDR